MKYHFIPVTAFAQNCTIFWCEKTKAAVVIDPGGDLDLIESFLVEKGLRLEKILVTHGHIDHAGGAAAFSKKTKAPIEGPHLADRFWIEGMPKQSLVYGFSDVESFEPDRWLQDGDVVTFGEESLQVLHCPGHTPGHVVFFHAASLLAQVGDVLFQGSIGRTDFPKGNYEELMDSIHNKLLPLGDDVAFIPGHGSMSTFGEERQHNPFLR